MPITLSDSGGKTHKDEWQDCACSCVILEFLNRAVSSLRMNSNASGSWFRVNSERVMMLFVYNNVLGVVLMFYGMCGCFAM